MSSIKRRGKQIQILGGQQRGNGSAQMISMAMQFIIINFKKKGTGKLRNEKKRNETKRNENKIQRNL